MRYLLLILLCIIAPFAFSEFKVEVITNELKQPWGVAPLPSGDFLVTEKSGQLRVVSANGVISSPIKGLPEVSVVGQGGLLDVVLHPQFSSNGFIYLSYVSGDSTEGYGTEVMRAHLKGNELVDTKRLFVALPKVQGGRHFGSRLVFDNAGYLYISLGDRGRRDEAQNLKSHLGSLIRLHDNGAVPSDNPFVNSVDAKPEIFSYGHRNMQGMTLHPVTGEVWVHEHGPQGGDEVNVIAKGKNYGWPVITYGAEYGSGLKIGEGTHKSGMEQPIYFWDPSIAPSGMAFLNNHLYVGALKYQLLSQLTLKDKLVVKEQRFFENQFGRIRDVEVSEENTLYLLTDSNRGQLVRLTLSSQ